ncbi:MAG: ferrous iron transporter B [Candidatus Omnitrophica bacterium]|nr:ferrous iron transporter B [Candidatus Omnitrophota bacterium]
MQKILLMGNPNVGKSAVFSRLTGARVVISNYPGTTVEFMQGYMKLGEQRPVVIDVPGVYSLEPTSRAEEVAIEMLDQGDVIINVVDATNLERNLYLTLQLLQRQIPVIVALNMWDDTRHKGITIDVKKLEQIFGVPVVTTCGLTGEGIKQLVERLPQAHAPKKAPCSAQKCWDEIGIIIAQVQKLTHRHHTWLERLEDLSIQPLGGLVLAAAVVFLSFSLIRFLGEGLINNFFNPFFENIWLPLLYRFSAVLGGKGLLHYVLIGESINGQIDFGVAFGLLTTGLYVPLAMVLPYIFSFYLVLGLWEDLGYLPRFAVLTDNLMHRIGLHGYAVIPMILGLGCNVPGALATRLLEGRREKFIAATLMAVAIPCMAQIAMIVGLVGARGGQYLGIVFGTLFLLLVFKGILLNKLLKGRSPEILTEIPPYRLPQVRAVCKKLSLRVVGFLKEALPYVLLGILFVNILQALKIIDALAAVFSPVLQNIWGLPKEAISALIVGFLRKDVAIGMLGPLELSTKQLVIGSTILAVYFPCIATFTVLLKELGPKDMLKSAVLMLITAVIVGGLLNLILPF